MIVLNLIFLGIIKKIGYQAAICILFNVFSATVFADQHEVHIILSNQILYIIY